MNRFSSIAFRRSALLFGQQREAVSAFHSTLVTTSSRSSSSRGASMLLLRCRSFSSNASSSSSIESTTTMIPPTNATPAAAAAAAAATTAVASEAETTINNTNINNINLLVSGQVQRHGRGDAVITLNVGGKEFCTLRSTVAANSVLTQHVSRAEQNSELTYGKGGNCAVFIDRDPTHFGLILNHLRNKVEGLSYYKSTAKKSASLLTTTMRSSSSSSERYVQLPSEIDALRDIYLEAQHYQISELQAASCEQNAIVTIIGAIEGKHGGNPFDKLAKISQLLRRGFVAFGSMGTIAIGSQQDHTKWLSQLFPTWFPPSEEDETTNSNTKDDDNDNNKISPSTPPIA